MPGTKSNRQLTGENSKFVFAIQPSFSAEGNGSRVRTFAGVAYSGEVIRNHYFWGDVVFDLSTTQVPTKLPALIDHDRGQRCGYVTDCAITNESGITVLGNLLSNEHGKAVAQDSDEGFPWQMSVHITPGSVEEVSAGTTVSINGRALTGPLVVFRNSTLSEVSFTATGWDSNTSAAAMSRGGDNPPATQGNDTMDLNQALARVAALEAEQSSLKASNDQLTKDLATANAAIEKFAQDARASEIQHLFKDVGREYAADSEEVKAFSSMPKDAFAVTAKIMRDQFSKATPVSQAQGNAHLFSHQAGNGQPAPTAAPAATNPLLADASARAQQFSK